MDLLFYLWFYKVFLMDFYCPGSRCGLLFYLSGFGFIVVLNLCIAVIHKLWKIFIHNHLKYYLFSFASPPETPIKYLLFASHFFP